MCQFIDFIYQIEDDSIIETHGSSMTSAHYSRLGQQECEKVHIATLEILARVGVDVHDEPARSLLVKGGAKCDGIRIRIPEHVVAKALATTPKRITLCDRYGKVAIRAGGYRTYYGGGSDCLNILDHRTGQRRKPVLGDDESTRERLYRGWLKAVERTLNWIE